MSLNSGFLFFGFKGEPGATGRPEPPACSVCGSPMSLTSESRGEAGDQRHVYTLGCLLCGSEWKKRWRLFAKATRGGPEPTCRLTIIRRFLRQRRKFISYLDVKGKEEVSGDPASGRGKTPSEKEGEEPSEKKEGEPKAGGSGAPPESLQKENWTYLVGSKKVSAREWQEERKKSAKTVRSTIVN